MPIDPVRFFDTRTGLGGVPTAKLAAGGTLNLQVTGVNGIPATNVKAVAINVTGTNSSASSVMVFYAGGTTRPDDVSSLQVANVTRSQLAIVPVGTDGKISIYSSGATLDLVGYYTTGTRGLKLHTIGATRILNTNIDGGPVAGASTTVVSQGNLITAADATLVLNITNQDPTVSDGFLTVYPDGITRPATSDVPVHVGENIPNLDLAKTGNGKIDIWDSQGSGNVHLIIDCFGYFAAN